MEKTWLKQYPAGVPAEIDVDPVRVAGRAARRELPQLRERAGLQVHGQGDHLRARSTTPRRALAAWLQAQGLAKGDRVAVMMPNVPQYPVAVAAILRAGLVVVNVNPLYTPRELEHQLKDSGAKAIVILENFASVAGSR